MSAANPQWRSQRAKPPFKEIEGAQHGHGPSFLVDGRFFGLAHGHCADGLLCFDLELKRICDTHTVPLLPYEPLCGAGAQCWDHLIVAGGCTDVWYGPLQKRVIALPIAAAQRRISAAQEAEEESAQFEPHLARETATATVAAAAEKSGPAAVASSSASANVNVPIASATTTGAAPSGSASAGPEHESAARTTATVSQWKWTDLAALRTARMHFGLCSANGWLIAYGGQITSEISSAEVCATAEVEVLQRMGGEWTALPPMPCARNLPIGFVI
jgi:hypothetical protein